MTSQRHSQPNNYQATDNQRRQLLVEQTNLAYAKLRENKKAWKAFRKELRELDATPSDGL
jgi:hypothetical protein